MYWIDKFRLAEIHRETYIAILQSWVPHGKKEGFAERCGITQEYLSCLCVLDNQFEGKVPIHKRYPSSQLARKMAQALPAPQEIKRSLIENVELARINAVETQDHFPGSINHQFLIQQLSELEKLHRKATFGKDLEEQQLSYRLVRDISKNLLHRVDPEKYPDSFAQLCLYYHDVQCVLNRPDEALFHAKAAQLVLESIDGIEAGYTGEQRDNLKINAIRGEAIAYHNLGLDRLVPDILINRAYRASAYQNSRMFWEPLVKRDLINSMAQIPRFSIREVNKIARQIESISEHNGDEFTLLLVHESWLRSLIKRDKVKLAQRIFDEEVERLPHLPYVGALHQALLFKSGARLAWQLHDIESWRLYMGKAVHLMYEAGLKHQLGVAQQTYGAALDPIFDECGIRGSAGKFLLANDD